MSEQTLAQRVVAAMMRDDRVSQSLGMQVEGAAEGAATVVLTVREDMINGHHTCHGGIIFSLADSALAFACNSRNLRTVAAGCAIEYLAPAKVGDTLRAEAAERSLGNRLGVYDVTITNQRGETVALFRGKSCRISGGLVED